VLDSTLNGTGDVAGVLRAGALDAFPLRATGDGWVEVGLGWGSVTLLLPDVWLEAARLEPHLRRSRGGYAPLVFLGDDATLSAHRDVRTRADGEIALEVLPLTVTRLTALLQRHDAALRLRRAAAEEEMVSDRYQLEIDSLNAIGRALSSERNIDRLLALILARSRFVTDADAGSIYVIEGTGPDIKHQSLRFKVSQNDSVPMDFAELSLPVSPQSIVGRCVLERSVINIPDLYRLDPQNPWGFKHNRAFDARIGYETHSMLAVPMIDHDDEVIGVIQLINRKRRPEATLTSPADFARWVLPFGARAQGLATTLASQAAIALENAMLYDDIRSLFEGFVTASVTAIEQRDPTTSGHSQRVADLTVMLARMTERGGTGRYASYHASSDELKQIEYAALLHDFGKVGVREHVLVKAKKLYDHERELLLARFDFIRRDLEADLGKRKVAALLERGPAGAAPELAALDAELGARLGELDAAVALVLGANEPTVLDQAIAGGLGALAARTYTDARGALQPYLTPREVEALQVARGSLTAKERVEIENHVAHTYNFLRRIPWGRTFRNIPEYAGAHHEKLDGSGYPRQLRGEAIPIPARMMTISDIYDALTASDRPYKRAVSVEKALDILQAEVKAGKCDAELFQIFIEAEVWRVAHGPRSG
jgi:HD-GYP domain-containing protein (c-di-GMP phosphodiesterase class II)